MTYLKHVATLKLSVDACVGCGRCVEVCPHGVFVIEGKKARITDLDRCMECGACAGNCAVGALSVTAGVGCAAAMLDGMRRFGDPDKGTCCSGDGGGAGNCC